MGKSIEESIKELEILKKNTFSYMSAHQAFTTAVNIMRKYQKIAELYDYWRSGKCEYTISCMENIGKVLRGGDNGK